MSFFAPPKDIQTTVFASLPDEFRRKDVEPEWGTGMRTGQPLDSFLEGPSFDRDGNLYLVNIPYGEILKLSPAGEFNLVARYDGWPNGLKIHKDGRLFVADYKNGIMVVDPVNGKVEPYVTHRWTESFRGTNDLHFASNGDLYFTDQGQTGIHDPTGRVYRYTTDGRLQRIIGNGPSPNGLVLSPDEKLLFVGMTRGNAAWRVPLVGDGDTTKASIYIQLSGGHGGPDGLAIDEQGGLLICHVGLGSIWHFDPHGEPLHRIRTCAGRTVTNCAFGGPGNRTLYITESSTGSILTAELPVAGQRMFAHM